MELSPKTKQYHRQHVGSLVVQNPMLTVEGMRLHLEKKGLTLTRHYIASHVKAIQTERIKRANTWTLNHSLAALRDAMAEIARVGWEIANDKSQPGRDRAAALREVREAYNLIFEKMFDAGVFERKIGTLDLAVRNTPLTDEKKQAISAALTNWGLLQPFPEDRRSRTSSSPEPTEDAGTTSPAG